MNTSLIETYAFLKELGIIVERKGKKLILPGTSISFTANKDSITLSCDRGDLLIPLINGGSIDIETIIYRVTEVMFAETGDHNSNLVKDLAAALNKTAGGRKKNYKLRHNTIENLDNLKTIVVIPFDNCMVVTIYSGIMANNINVHKLTLPNEGLEIFAPIIHGLAKMAF